MCVMLLVSSRLLLVYITSSLPARLTVSRLETNQTNISSITNAQRERERERWVHVVLDFLLFCFLSLNIISSLCPPDQIGPTAQGAYYCKKPLFHFHLSWSLLAYIPLGFCSARFIFYVCCTLFLLILSCGLLCFLFFDFFFLLRLIFLFFLSNVFIFISLCWAKNGVFWFCMYNLGLSMHSQLGISCSCWFFFMHMPHFIIICHLI